jgi:peroxiredoxin
MLVRPVLGSVAALALFAFGVAPAAPTQNLRVDAAPARVAAAALDEQDLSQIVEKLDAALSASQDPSRWVSNAKMAAWNFTRQIQSRTLSRDQEKAVLAHLVALKHQYPAGAAAFDQAHRIISKFTVGKVAPEIVGKNLDGKTMRLTDYRGRVVVLAFSGHWCGICRSDYPYDRKLIERYGSSSFAFLGVNSDADRNVARKAYQDNGLDFRAWWDGPKGGPIATAWEVTGWPTVYVLDGQGVIRFVDLRQDDLLNGVGELLTEPAGTR